MTICILELLDVIIGTKKNIYNCPPRIVKQVIWLPMHRNVYIKFIYLN